MNPTGKAGRPRNKPPDLNGKTQFERFVETAEALGATDGGAEFLRAMKLIAKPAKSDGSFSTTDEDDKTGLTAKAEPEKMHVRTKKSGSAD